LLTTVCSPASPGIYAEWPILSGAPTAWQAVLANDMAYIEPTAAGQRQSFGVTLPPIEGSDTLVSAAIRGYASVPTPGIMIVPNGGFESASDWILDTTCDNNGVAYSTINPHSGTRCITITSQRALGLTTCGNFSQTIPGFQIGHTYRAKLWWRATGLSTGRNATITTDIGSLGSITGVTPAGAWQQFTCSDFVATATSHLLLVTQAPGLSSTAFTRAFDDVTIEEVASDGSLVPFYRLYGQDHDLPTWSIPIGTTVPTLQPGRAVTGFTAVDLRDGGLEIGVRNAAAPVARLDQIELDLTLQAFSGRAPLAGHRGWTRRRAA
jgi:hypothetical protein